MEIHSFTGICNNYVQILSLVPVIELDRYNLPLILVDFKPYELYLCTMYMDRRTKGRGMGKESFSTKGLINILGPFFETPVKFEGALFVHNLNKT